MDYKEKESVAIIGAGPAGCMCAYYASKNADVTLFDASNPLHTLLYTGGGRCNLAYGEYDFKELAKFYPRGEKFLYSVFSKFSTADTLNFFDEIGVETYPQEDLRIFPTSNSAKDVREKFLNSLKKCKFIKEKVLDVCLLDSFLDCRVGNKFPPRNDMELESFTQSVIARRHPSGAEEAIQNEKVLNIAHYPSLAEGSKSLISGESKNAKFQIKTNNNVYYFDKVVIATGGHAGFSLAKNLGHTIIEPKPALTGLISAENFKNLQGVSLKDIEARIFYPDKNFAPSCDLRGDLLFTHEGISGPLAYKISSICARLDYNKQNPLVIKLNLICHANNDEILKRVQDDVRVERFDFQGMLNANPKKDIKNLIAEFVPKSLAEYVLEINNLDANEKCTNINGQMRDLILKSLSEFNITVISPAKEGEIITSGGVCLDEIDSKTMQSKLVNGLYFCGEVIDVDGFCGGFNLQNCWSTGFIAGVNQ